MADGIYNAFKEGLADGTVDWVAATVTVELIKSTSTYVFDPDDTEAGVTIVQPTDVSYAAQTLASKTVTRDDANNWIVFDAADLAFGSLAGAETVIGYYVHTATVPILYVDSVADKVLQGDPFTIQFAATGLATLA